MSPSTALLLLAAVAALALAAALVLRRSPATRLNRAPRPLRVRTPLSVAQQVLLARLHRALPSHLVFTQVQALRLLDPGPRARLTALQLGLHRMSFDFVVCDPNGAVMAVIDLDDPPPTTRRRSRQARRKERACAAAGLRRLQWSPRTLPDEAAIHLEFDAHRQAQMLIQGVIDASRPRRRA